MTPGTTKQMTTQMNNFNPGELCSRKLWEIVNHKDPEADTPETLEAALQELAQRRHYLQQLKELDLDHHEKH